MTFRGLNSVYLKLQNFKTVDPAYAGAGMSAGAGRRERGVWEQYAHDPPRLRDAALTIVQGAQDLSPDQLASAASEMADDEIPEGELLFALHRRHERKSARRKKRAVLSSAGCLACEVCGFDFAATYGALGENYAECHHKKPLADGKRVTRLADLAIVCANCHRMLHRWSPPLTTDDLRSRHGRFGRWPQPLALGQGAVGACATGHCVPEGHAAAPF